MLDQAPQTVFVPKPRAAPGAAAAPMVALPAAVPAAVPALPVERLRRSARGPARLVVVAAQALPAEPTAPVVLGAAGAAQLFDLFDHARTCPCQHVCAQHAAVCSRTKRLMVHVRDCSGTTSDGQPCPTCAPVIGVIKHEFSEEREAQRGLVNGTAAAADDDAPMALAGPLGGADDWSDDELPPHFSESDAAAQPREFDALGVRVATDALVPSTSALPMHGIDAVEATAFAMTFGDVLVAPQQPLSSLLTEPQVEAWLAHVDTPAAQAPVAPPAPAPVAPNAPAPTAPALQSPVPAAPPALAPAPCGEPTPAAPAPVAPPVPAPAASPPVSERDASRAALEAKLVALRRENAELPVLRREKAELAARNAELLEQLRRALATAASALQSPAPVAEAAARNSPKRARARSPVGVEEEGADRPPKAQKQ